jgi:catalase-peroxidase
MGGPAIRFATGRVDFPLDAARARHGPSGCPFGDGAQGNPHGSRLPAADLGPAQGCPAKASAAEREAPTINHIRATFDRLGMNDRETVALIILGHQFGRCHLETSGFDGTWYAFDPTHWNVYENGLGYMSL